MVAQPAAHQGRQNSARQRHQTEGPVRIGQRHAAHADEKGRHPHLHAADGKGQHGHSQAACPECFIAKQAGHGVAFKRSGHAVGAAALRLRQGKHQQPQQQPRNRSHIERRPPAVVTAEIAPEKVAHGGPRRNRQIKDREYPSALSLAEKVRDVSRSNGHEGGLAHSHQGVTNQQRAKVVGHGRQQRGSAPDEGADDHD